MCIMCVYKQESWTDRDARPCICHCARVILDILPWKRRSGDRGHREVRGGIVDRLPGIPIIAVIPTASMTPPLSSSRLYLPLDSHEARMPRFGTKIPFPYLVWNLYSRLELDDGVSGAFMKKKIIVGIAARITRSRLASRFISESSSCGTSRTRNVMSLAFENFFLFIRTIENRVKSGLYVFSCWRLTDSVGNVCLARIGSVSFLPSFPHRRFLPTLR